VQVQKQGAENKRVNMGIDQGSARRCFNVREQHVDLCLDVGCGKNKRGDIGVDYSRDSDADIIADAECLPFKDGAFAKVVSVTVLEHSPNPLNFLKEQYRVLKKGGQVEVTTDNAQYFRWSIMNFRGVRHEDYCADHYMIFYPKNVSRLLHLVGFKVTSAHFIRDNKKMDRIVGFITRFRILRKDCQYHRFKISARK
jgi:SAM-dependent methyltransferase